VSTFFRLLIIVGLGLFACFSIASYLRELFVFFTDRDAYDQMQKPNISYNEDGDRPVGTADRLLFSYPLFIGLSAGGAIVLCWQMLNDFA
jgi:hypothetical protein